MKKTTALKSILIVVSFICCNIAQAESRVSYIGIGAGVADTSTEDLSEDVDLDVLVLQFGFWTAKNSSIEVRMGEGIGDDSTGPVDVEIENIGGLYGTYHWHLGNQFSVYGIAGGSRAAVKISMNGGSDQEYENGFSYGAGMKISIVSVEFMRYLDTNEIEADAVSVSLQYTFD